MTERPSPQDYTDYRSYLRDMVTHLKETVRSFSYRSFAKRSGFSSTGFLKHVIDGERNLAMPSVAKVARGLRLSEQEASAFELLVALHHASDDDTRTELLRRLRASKLRKRIAEDEFELYSSWWMIPVRELLAMVGAPVSPVEIARRLLPRIKPTEAKRAIAVLRKLGFLEVADDGSLRAKQGTLETAPQVKSLAVRNYHRQMLQRAAASLDALAPEQRSVTSISLQLTPEQVEELGRRISAFQDELLDTLPDTEPSAAAAEVYDVAFTVVPVTWKDEP